MEKTTRIGVSLMMALLLSFSLVSAAIYDDFSNSELDLTKWTASVDPTAPANIDEYYLDAVNGNYHMANLNRGHKGTLLMLDRDFNDGDILEYDVLYQQGSENILSRLFVDGTFLEYIIGSNTHGYATSGSIGYWNGNSEIGNVYGTYHVRVNFMQNSIAFEITNPTGSIWRYTADGQIAPYTFGVATKTGDNGIGHFDYDNFEVIEPVNPIDELNGRIDNLEARVANLEIQNLELQEIMVNLQTENLQLQTKLTDHLNDTTLIDRINMLEASLGILQDEVSNFWTAIDTAAQKVFDKLQPQIDNHEKRINTLEKYIRLLEKYGWFKNIFGR